MKKLLWVNPSFLDYRIPLYDELNKLCNNNFYIIYSKRRVPQRCIEKIEARLGSNACGLETEKVLSFGRKGDFANTNISIPFPKGLYRLMRDVTPNVIIAEGFFQFTPWAVLYSWLHRIPLLIAYERTAHTERNCPVWRRLYRRFVGLFVNGYVVNGTLTKEYLISQGVKAEKIFTGAMCADSFGLASQVSSLSEQERTDLKRCIFQKIPSGVSFAFIGQMIPRKGVYHLLQGWIKHINRYPEDRLLLVGGGPLLEEFRREFGQYESVIFTGEVDYSQIYRYYAISDVFVIPTLEDNWSLVVPEAMACGLPIASSVYNGCYPDLVHSDVNGFIFDPLDHNSVLNALEYFHSADLAEMGRHSVKIESEYNPQNTAKRIFDAVETTIANCC